MAEAMVNEAQQWFWLAGLIRKALVNEEQVITETNVSGGTFKARWEGSAWSSNLAYNISAAALQTALEGLSTVGSGNVAVSGSAGGPYTITAAGECVGTPMNKFQVDGALLTGSTPTIEVARTVAGEGRLPKYLYLGLSKATRETLGDAITMASIQEVTGSGYVRQKILTTDVEIFVTLSSGFYQFLTKDVTQGPAGGTWDEAKSVFLTDRDDNSGKIVGVRTIAAFTLTVGQSTDVNLKEEFTDPVA